LNTHTVEKPFHTALMARVVLKCENERTNSEVKYTDQQRLEMFENDEETPEYLAAKQLRIAVKQFGKAVEAESNAKTNDAAKEGKKAVYQAFNKVIDKTNEFCEIVEAASIPYINNEWRYYKVKDADKALEGLVSRKETLEADLDNMQTEVPKKLKESFINAVLADDLKKIGKHYG